MELVNNVLLKQAIWPTLQHVYPLLFHKHVKKDLSFSKLHVKHAYQKQVAQLDVQLQVIILKELV